MPFHEAVPRKLHNASRTTQAAQRKPHNASRTTQSVCHPRIYFGNVANDLAHASYEKPCVHVDAILLLHAINTAFMIRKTHAAPRYRRSGGFSGNEKADAGIARIR